MNKNTKNQATEKKHKFTFIDGIVLFIAIVLVGVAALLIVDPFQWFEKSDIDVQERTILCVMKVSSLSEEECELIKEGDEVIFFGDKKVTGKIISVDIKDDIYVTFEIVCSYNKGIGYFMNGKQLLVGAKDIGLTFKIDDGESNILGECLSIREQK